MNVTEFVDEKLSIALDYRGLAKYNPVEIIIEGNGHTFVVLVSHLEPDTLTVPYNVTWINSDPEHKDYKVLMRRVDAEKYDDSDYRGSWSVLSTVETIFEEVQYFKKESDPILGEVEQFRPPLASDKAYGGVYLSHAQDEPLNPIMVGTNDERMSNARAPRPHSHPDFPRTMLAAGDGSENFVNISTINDPVAGQMLFIKGVDDNGHYVGEWLFPTAEFPYIGPRPVSISVVGPTVGVPGASRHVLRADVLMDDGVTLRSVDAVWTLTTNKDHATINPATGVFVAGLVTVDTPVSVIATFTHPDSKDVVTTEYVITIIGDPTLVILDHISIGGRTTFPKNETETYPVTAHYTDGSSAVVVPDLYVSSNTSAGTFAGGKLTPNANQIGSVSTRLTATVTKNGVTRSAFIDVTITDPTVYPSTLTITGPVEVNQAEAIDLKAHVKFTDDTEADVTGAVWSVVSNVFATIDQTGKLTAKPLTAPGSKSVTVNCSYTQAGVTKTASKVVAILDNKNWPVSAKVLGATKVEPSTTSTYQYEVTYTDGTKLTTKVPVWSSSNETMATISAAGLATFKTVEGNVTIRAVYSEDGVNLNANLVVAIATVVVTLPDMRWGVAMFANPGFTGGVRPEDITPEMAADGFDVVTNPSPANKDYTHWTGFDDFVAKVMTNHLPLVGTAQGDINTPVAVDEFIYVMWPKERAENIRTLTQPSNFEEQFTGVNWLNDKLGNYDGLPGYNPDISDRQIRTFDDGTGPREWVIMRSDNTPNSEGQTREYKVNYVP